MLKFTPTHKQCPQHFNMTNKGPLHKGPRGGCINPVINGPIVSMQSDNTDLYHRHHSDTSVSVFPFMSSSFSKQCEQATGRKSQAAKKKKEKKRNKSTVWKYFGFWINQSWYKCDIFYRLVLIAGHHIVSLSQRINIIIPLPRITTLWTKSTSDH